MSGKLDLLARLDADSSGFEKGMKRAEASAKVFEREMAKAEARQTASIAHVTNMRSRYEREAAQQAQQAAARRNDAMVKAGQVSLATGAVLATGLALSARAALDWESAWAGVTKTVDGNAEQMGALESELRSLAGVLPTTHTEIAAVAEAAGQLGVKRADVAGFTKTMIDLGQTTNLSADEAATAIAQMANVMGTSTADVDRLGSTLVALGNAGASTEREILDMALRLSGAGKLVGATEADVLALANAMASMGIEAELGGGAMSRTLLKIYAAAKEGGDAVQGFADVAGMSAEQFTAAFEADPIRAVDAFVQGLGRIDTAGGNVVGTLDDLGISGTQDLQVLLRLKGAGDLLAGSLDLGAQAWKANTALLQEAEKRYETTAARMQIAKNSVNDLAIELGSFLLPALAGVADGVAGMARWLADLPGPVQGLVVVVATLAAGVSLAGGAALIAVPKIMAFKVSVDALAVSAPRAATAVTFLGRAFGMAGIAVAAAAVGYALGKLAENLLQRDAPALDAYTTSLLDFANKGRITGEAGERLGEQFGKLGYVLKVANSNKLNIFDGNGAMQINEYRDLLKGLDETLAGLVTSGKREEAAALFADASRAAQEQGSSVEELNGWLVKYGEAQRAAGAEADTSTTKAHDLADAVTGVQQGVEGATGGLGDYAAAMGLGEEATKALVEEVKDWGAVLTDFVQPLGAYTGLLEKKKDAERESAQAQAEATEDQADSWETFVKDVAVSVDEYLDELERQVEAQRAWETNMLILSSKVSPAVLQMLRDMGQEAAPLIAEFVNSTDEELARLEPLAVSRTESAMNATGQQILEFGPVGAYLAGRVGQGVVNELAAKISAGKTTVAAIMEQYGITISNGVIVPIERANARLSGLTANLDRLDGRRIIIGVDYRTTGGERVFDGRLQEFASGGLVRGPGTSTSDDVPIWASDREYVQQAKAVAHYGVAFMDDVNNLRIPKPRGYAEGGLVSFAAMPAASAAPVTTAGSPGRAPLIGGNFVMTESETLSARDVIFALRDLQFRLDGA